MSPDGNPRIEGVVARARALILTPSAEWERIASEPASIRSLFTPYVLILAAIAPVCSVVGGAVFGYGVLGRTFRPNLFGLLASEVVRYGLSLFGVFLMGVIIDAVAPSFGGTRDRIKAFKVAAFFPTGMWLAGVFGLFPPFAILSILGLYSLFLLYRGLPLVMKCSPDKATVYTLVVILAAIVVYLVIATLVATISLPLTMGGMSV